MRKRMLSLLLALGLAASLLPKASAEDIALVGEAEAPGTPITVIEAEEAAAPLPAETEAKGGKWGKTLTWALEEDGTLTIGGKGPMVWPVPWEEDRAGIKKVVIEDGVTSICNNAFSECYALKSVQIPGSMKTIEYSAFRA